MIVMKFGGTSIGDAAAIRRTISIITKKMRSKPVVVVSACSGVTNLLHQLVDFTEEGEKEKSEQIISSIKQRHKSTVDELASGVDPKRPTPDTAEINQKIDTLCNSLWTLSKAHMGGQIPDADKAYMISLGEYLSSNIVCFMMNALGLKTAWLDARHFMITSHDYLTAAADVPEVQKRATSVIERAFKNADAVITQGFMGVTIEGDPTIMGRGSSDYSASLLGMVLDADRIEIWTDVDGICTADPNIVPEARGISKLSYEEAAELARFGAKVLHPLSIEPAASKNIPLYVLNSMNPDCEGTVVMNRSCIFDGVKSISYNENIRMINIYSPKMINTSGFMSKIFGIFERQGVSVDMISTAEASVTVTVDASVNTDPLAAALSKLGNVTVDRDKSQVSIIGKNLIGVKGAVAAVFEAVSDSKIYMMSQGSSFLNLSIVVDRPEMTAVIRKLHKSFFENGN